MFETPQRRRIYLMRHGEAAYVSPQGQVTDDPRNVPLTASGADHLVEFHAAHDLSLDTRLICA